MNLNKVSLSLNSNCILFVKPGYRANSNHNLENSEETAETAQHQIQNQNISLHYTEVRIEQHRKRCEYSESSHGEGVFISVCSESEVQPAQLHYREDNSD